jgi:hypothetical protein
MAGAKKQRAPSSSSSDESVLDNEEEKFNDNGKAYFSSYDPNKYAHMYDEVIANQEHERAMQNLNLVMTKLDDEVLFVEN